MAIEFGPAKTGAPTATGGAIPPVQPEHQDHVRIAGRSV